MFKNIPQNVKVKLLSNFIGSVAYKAIFPFIALYFNALKGVVFTGVLISTTVVLSYIMRLLGGYLADCYSRKKIVLISNSVNCLSMIIMAISLAFADNLLNLFLAGYILHIVVTPVSGPSMQALIIDSTTQEMRKKIYTLTYWSMNVAASFGYFIGGMLYDSNKLLLFVVLATSSFITVILYAIFLEDAEVIKAKKIHKNPVVDILAHYLIAVRDIPFVLTVIGFGFLLVGEDTLPGFVGIRLQESFTIVNIFGLDITGVKMLSLLMLENTIFVTFMTLWMSKFTDRWSRKTVLLTGTFFYAIGFVLMSISLDFTSLIFFALVNSIGETITIPLFGAEQAGMMPEDKRASYIALSSLSNREATLIAGGLITLSKWFSSLMMSITLAIILLLGIIMMKLGLYNHKKRNLQSKLSA